MGWVAIQSRDVVHMVNVGAGKAPSDSGCFFCDAGAPECKILPPADVVRSSLLGVGILGFQPIEPPILKHFSWVKNQIFFHSHN